MPGALVFYEAPHRVAETLADLAAVLGERPAATARELTKLHETVVRGTLASLMAHVEREPPRGEFVLVVGAPNAAEAGAADDLDGRLSALMATMSVKDAAAVAAGETGRPKREVYARALRLAAGGAAAASDGRRSGEDRRRSLAALFGADAERLSLLLLILKGYWPLARRYRAPAARSTS